uniref:G_PROTEIN_RECEP_F1_2 domain-containing protein n=1 Tax=Syphacia muris TaxID=451379 RepID=A0A158R438_9BILA
MPEIPAHATSLFNSVSSSVSTNVHWKYTDDIGASECPDEESVIANHLLAALAATDIAVLVFMLPSWLASYPVFYNSNKFRTMLGSIKIQIGAMANWFSCAAIWFVLIISVERVLIIKSLKPYKVSTTDRFGISLLIATCLKSFHFSHHSLSRKCVMIKMCNNGGRYSEVYALCLPSSFENWSIYDPSWQKPSKMLDLYINIGTVCNAVVGVICPVFIVAFMNILLINLLRKSKLPNMSTTSGKLNTQIQEKRITKTIVTVVTCFTITNIPSGFLFLYETFFYDPSTRVSTTFSRAASISNFLVLTGKSLNIILLCLCSNTFW